MEDYNELLISVDNFKTASKKFIEDLGDNVRIVLKKTPLFRIN
jgi:hypothetical protein